MNPRHSSLPAAVLWDYDGTIVDTQPIWHQVECDIVAMYGKTWTDDQAIEATGTSIIRAAELMVEAIGDPSLSVEEIADKRVRMVADRVASAELQYRPGAKELLSSCREAGIPCALFTASPKFVLDAGLSRMPKDWFQVIVDGDEAPAPKPAPDGYILAAKKLGVDIEACLVIDDSEVGTAAGRASGAAVLGIPAVTPLTPCPGLVIRDSLVGITAGDLSGIFHEAKASVE